MMIFFYILALSLRHKSLQFCQKTLATLLSNINCSPIIVQILARVLRGLGHLEEEPGVARGGGVGEEAEPGGGQAGGAHHALVLPHEPVGGYIGRLQPQYCV